MAILAGLDGVSAGAQPVFRGLDIGFWGSKSAVLGHRTCGHDDYDWDYVAWLLDPMSSGMPMMTAEESALDAQIVKTFGLRWLLYTVEGAGL